MADLCIHWDSRSTRSDLLFCGWRTPFLRRYPRGPAGGSTQLASTPSCQPQPRRHSRRRTAGSTQLALAPSCQPRPRRHSRRRTTGSTQLTSTPSCQPMQRESKEGTLWHCNGIAAIQITPLFFQPERKAAASGWNRRHLASYYPLPNIERPPYSSRVVYKRREIRQDRP